MTKHRYRSDDVVMRAAPERIYALLADSTRISQWAPMIKNSTGGFERVGTIRTCMVQWNGKASPVTERCVVADPTQRIAWEQTEGGLTQLFHAFRFGFILAWAPNGHTRVRMEHSYWPRNIFAAVIDSLVVRRTLSRLRRELLANIQRLVEK